MNIDNYAKIAHMYLSCMKQRDQVMSGSPVDAKTNTTILNIIPEQ